MKLYSKSHIVPEYVIDDGYKKLACAIVEQAVEDYKTTCMIEMPYSRGLAQKPLETFFRSQWCYDLCGVSKDIWEDFFTRSNSIELEEDDDGVRYNVTLKRLMMEHGITQAELVRGTGIAQGSASCYIRGASVPGEKNRLLIKKYFDSL